MATPDPNRYWTESATPLKAVLASAYPKSTWAILWSAAHGLVIEGQDYETQGLYYLCVPAGLHAATGALKWKVWMRYSPAWLPRSQARASDPEVAIDPISAIGLVYPGTKWAEGALMAASTRCRTCKAPIIWIETTEDKAMPCEARPILVAPEDKDKPQVTVVTTSGEVVTGRKVLNGDVIGPTVSGHESHFAYCPQAALHRRASR